MFQVLGLLVKNEIEVLIDWKAIKFYWKQSGKIDKKEVHSQDGLVVIWMKALKGLDYWAYGVQERDALAY